jgi:hypothetical protein
MIEQLYGVDHGYHHLLIPEGLKVHPSIELMSNLLALPAGTKVGIEYTPKFDRPYFVDGQRFFDPPTQRFYWQRLRAICREAEHKIIYLEDFSTYKEYVRKENEIINLTKKIKKKTPNEEKQKLLGSIYKLQVEAEYIHQVKRETAILNLIQKHQPTVVILGRGHTDYLMFNSSSRLDPKGIKVNSYQVETPDSPSGTLYFFDEDIRRGVSTKLNKNPTLESRHDANWERFFLERRLKAVTEGRVTNGTPNFIGTWNTYIPAQGLFEIYVEDANQFSGKIEDCLGTAVFRGNVDENQISFLKIYLPSDSLKEAFRGAIAYQGNRIGDFYKGEFEHVYSEDRRKKGGEFILQKA